MSDTAPFNPERLFRALDNHKVKYVLIGALAARLYGFPRLTADADITPSGSNANLERLTAALNDLSAKVYTETIPEGLAFDCSPEMLNRGSVWNLVTTAGRIDLCIKPSGTSGYDDLVKEAVKFEAFGITFLAASIDDIIRMKRAADRPKDREDVLLLKEVKRRTSET